MLSYIYRLIHNFEQTHQFLPNLLYLNPVHMQYLQDGVAQNYTLQTINDLLGMELIINRDVVHPHVAWTQTARKRAS